MAVKKAVTTADIKPEAETKSKKGAVSLVSPTGSVTEVPDSIVDILIESGYTRK